jgi:hypothetical protein
MEHQPQTAGGVMGFRELPYRKYPEHCHVRIDRRVHHHELKVAGSYVEEKNMQIMRDAIAHRIAHHAIQHQDNDEYGYRDYRLDVYVMSADELYEIINAEAERLASLREPKVF